MKVYRLGFARDEFKDPWTSSAFMKIANLPDGWVQSKQCRFEQHATNLDAIVHLWTDEEIRHKFGVYDGVPLSYTVMNQSPRRIYFNRTNLHSPPSMFKGSKEDYFKYVVQHELGHAIFNLGHQPIGTKVRQECHVMSQQTKGTPDCLPGYKAQ